MYNMLKAIQGISNLFRLHGRRSLKLFAPEKKNYNELHKHSLFLLCFYYCEFQVQTNL